LKKAAWAAGIIGAAVAAWLGLSPPRQSADGKTSASAASCPSAAQIGAALKTAGGLGSPSARDSAYASLVRDALCSSDFDTAHAISLHIASLADRDDAYIEIVAGALKRQDIANANRASASISAPVARDRARSMILNGIRPPAS
jgi:hypothetical protein